MKMHLGILAGAALLLTACSNTQLQERVLGIALNESVANETTGPFPRFRPLLAAKQGPALDISVERAGVRGGFLRESKRGNIESWLGTDGVALTFDRGVLHGTRGLGAGLLASDVSASASAILAGRSQQVQRVHTFLTGEDIAVTQTYNCAIENQGRETITLDTGATATHRMVERCSGEDATFTNTYWVAKGRGGIVKSRQWSGDFAGMLAIQKVFNF